MIDRDQTSIGEAGPERTSPEVIGTMMMIVKRKDVIGGTDILSDIERKKRRDSRLYVSSGEHFRVWQFGQKLG
jgi:hypothetical protein